MTDLLNVDGASLAVYGAASVPGANEARDRLLATGIPGRLVAKDPALWGEAAESEAKFAWDG